MLRKLFPRTLHGHAECITDRRPGRTIAPGRSDSLTQLDVDRQLSTPYVRHLVETLNGPSDLEILRTHTGGHHRTLDALCDITATHASESGPSRRSPWSDLGRASGPWEPNRLKAPSRVIPRA